MISAVINTLNEEKNIERAIKSVKWADEVIVCDMYSDDQTVELAKELGAKVVFHKKTGYVEPARNFAISKASGDWTLILDADEEIPETLAKRLQDIAEKMEQINFVSIPRRNIIFGKWMRASMWWPDNHVRFFKKGSVKWKDEIHSKPETKGEGITLDEKETWAIIHYHYSSIFQFIERMNHYTNIQAKHLHSGGYKFSWEDLISKPLGEFLGRFFANRGYEDGLHGFALSLLQAFSFLIVYLKLWEMDDFKPTDLKKDQLMELSKKSGEEINYWFKFGFLSKNSFKRFFQKVKHKVS